MRFTTPIDVASEWVSNRIGINHDGPTYQCGGDDFRDFGILHLILVELRKQSRPDTLSATVKVRMFWRTSGAEKWFNACLLEAERINRLFPGIPGKLRRVTWDNLTYYEALYSRSMDHDEIEREIRRKARELFEYLEALESVKTVDDLIRIPGIGKKTLAKVKAGLNGEASTSNA